MLTLLLGGARSGKSSHAVRIASELSVPVVFVATAQPGDDDMRDRIARHRAERPAGWRTVEEPTNLRGALGSAAPGDCVIIDCLTVWTANIMVSRDVLADARAAASRAAIRPGRTIVISNEVGMGVHPTTPLGREYRDLLGHVNQIWASHADEAYLLVAGRALELS